MQNFSFVIGFVFSLVLTWSALKAFPVLGLLDFPERYGLQRPKLPYPGGLVFLLGLFIFLAFQPDLWWLILPVVLLGGVSLYDDLRPIPAWMRLLIHIGIAVWMTFLGVRVDFIGNPFDPGKSIDLTIFIGIPSLLAVGWIVAIQNALNWFDGIKGLAVGVSGVGFLVLGLFGLLSSDVLWEKDLQSFLLLSLYTAGVCFGALLFFLRGRIILGDTGSQILGFLLAVLSLMAGTKIALTLLVLSLPLLDSVMVVFRRVIVEKKSPFKGDLKHLHHNLSRHMSEQSTALLLIGLSLVFGMIALFLTGLLKLGIFLGVAFLVGVLNIWAIRKSPKNTNLLVENKK